MGKIALIVLVILGSAICLALLIGCLIGTVVFNTWAEDIIDWVDNRKRGTDKDD